MANFAYLFVKLIKVIYISFNRFCKVIKQIVTNLEIPENVDFGSSIFLYFHKNCIAADISGRSLFLKKIEKVAGIQQNEIIFCRYH